MVKIFSLGIILFVARKYSDKRIESIEMLSHQTISKKYSNVNVTDCY